VVIGFPLILLAYYLLMQVSKKILALIFPIFAWLILRSIMHADYLVELQQLMQPHSSQCDSALRQDPILWDSLDEGAFCQNICRAGTKLHSVESG